MEIQLFYCKLGYLDKLKKIYDRDREKICKTITIEGVDMIIALTHSDKSQDVALVKAVPEIDLVLGGHDHDLQNSNSTVMPVLEE